MSQSQFAAAAQPRPEQTTTVVDDETVQSILDALDDAHCRCILTATDGEALSASEISETCDLALSTAYRKLDTLTDLGLLSEQLRVRRSGKHTSEYRRAVDDVTVSVSPDGIELRVAYREQTTASPMA